MEIAKIYKVIRFSGIKWYATLKGALKGSQYKSQYGNKQFPIIVYSHKEETNSEIVREVIDKGQLRRWGIKED